MTRVPLEDSPESTSIKIAEGAYARKGTITKVEDLSNYPGRSDQTIFASGYKPDLCFDVTIDSYGKEKRLRLFGLFQRDKNSGAITGWNTWKNACKELLYRIIPEYVEKDDEDQSIPKDVLDRLIGKEIQYIRYVTASTYTGADGKEKPSFADYSNVFAASATKDEMAVEFIEESAYLMSNKNMDRRYYPEAIKKFAEDKDPATQEMEDESINSAPVSDDDVPF